MMRARAGHVARTTWTAMFGFALAGSGCNELIGLTGYSTRADASDLPGVTVPTADGGTVSLDASCNGDSSTACYACPPVTNVQFLNACTSATCVPFDDVDRLTHLLPDGSLPPLPPVPSDGGGDSSPVMSGDAGDASLPAPPSEGGDDSEPVTPDDGGED